MSEFSLSLHTNQTATPKLTSLPPISLYIHVPWCVRKCPYCDFNSHQLKHELDEQAYISALLTDLEAELPYFWGRTVHTVFIGGGTPSILSAASLEQLLSGIRARINLLPAAEITLEANPGTFERQRFAGYAAAGINRLSIGVQSFADDKLAILERIHSRDDALRAIEVGLSLFPKVNVDLMYALPGQTLKQAQQDIQDALATGVQHISAYQLTLEPNTPFAHTPPPQLPDEDHLGDIEEAVHSALEQAGFIHYETSAFTRSPQQCQHNLNYWQFGDYIGIGAGAHGKISSAQAIVRTTRSRHPKDYIQSMQQQPQRAISRQPVAAEDLPFEFMLNVLRLTAGVPTAWFNERTGLPLAVIRQAISEAVKRGLLDANPLFLRPTKLGRSFLNDLLALFLKA